MKAIICVGISGSGKSIWAEWQKRIYEKEWYESIDNSKCALLSVINRDETRWAVSGKLGWNGPNAYRFHSKIEGEVTEVNCLKMLKAKLGSKDIIIADTNLNPKTRNKLIEQCEQLGYEVEIKEFPISFQEACRRDAQRGIFSVGKAVLMKQWTDWCRYWLDKEELCR